MAIKIICDACGAEIPEKGPYSVYVTVPGEKLKITAQLPAVTLYRGERVDSASPRDICAKCIAGAFLLLANRHDEIVNRKS
jgi:hypothetical protein